MGDWSQDPERLERIVRKAILQRFEPQDLRHLVEQLSRISPPESPAWAFAHCKLAELLLEENPWRAAALARLVARRFPDDDTSRGLLGLALTVLGHYRCAASAYQEALALAPENPWYAHNLGHLLYVMLGQPRQALYWLQKAHRIEPHIEIAASLAQVLGHVGRAKDGLRVLRRGLCGEVGSSEHQELEAWLTERTRHIPERDRPGP